MTAETIEWHSVDEQQPAENVRYIVKTRHYAIEFAYWNGHGWYEEDGYSISSVAFFAARPEGPPLTNNPA
jgi:hypothetical protein